MTLTTIATSTETVKKEKPAVEEILPEDRKNNYSRQIMMKRLKFLEKMSSVPLHHLASSSVDPATTRGNIEKIIGFAQTPVGIVGPLQVNGRYAKGSFYVPMATLEGALVLSYNRGSRIIKAAGGASVVVIKDSIQRAPLFFFKNVFEAKDFISWCKLHFEELQKVVKASTKHGCLVGHHPVIMGNIVFVRFDYTTADAMGMNMITKATSRICEYICSCYPVERYVLESNLAADKKSSPLNMSLGRGKTVTAEILIPAKFINKYLHISPESIVEAYNAQMLGNIYGGLIGCNYHFANGLAAIFLACGQDIANIMESANGLTSLRMVGKDLYASVALPSLIIGTVGGGTAVGTQHECLNIMGCYGSNKALKLAEIIAVTILAGEISLAGSMAANDFATAHEKYGRNYPVIYTR